MGQQHVGAFQQLAQAFQQLAVEHAEQRQLGFQAQREFLAQLTGDPAQHVGPERQVLGIECRAGGEHAEALPQQLQRTGRALRLAPGDVGQHDVAVDIGVGDQGQRGGRHRRAGCRHVPHPRFAQVGQGRGQGVQEARRELRVDVVQAPGLGVDVGLDLAVAGAFGVAEQLALQLHDGQLERGAQGLHGQRVQRRQQAAHAWRCIDPGEPGRIG